MSSPSSAAVVSPLEAHEYSVKLYAADPADLEPRAFVPVFHQWIQTRRLEDELLIDVADYSHVHQGPGVLLIAHGAQYSLDQGGGRLGLLYSRKRRTTGDPELRVRAAFRSALRACRLLEEDASSLGKLRFRTDEALFKIHNKLLAPNTPESFQSVKGDIERFLVGFYGGAGEIIVEPTGSPKEPFGARIRVSGAPDLETLLSRVEGEAG
jgi:hypothetical protein